MKTTDGKCRIDSVEACEIDIDAILPNHVKLSVKYAYRDSTADRRVGYNNKNKEWGTETLAKLKEFLDAVEQELLEETFEGQPHSTTTSSGEALMQDTSPEIKSL